MDATWYPPKPPSNAGLYGRNGQTAYIKLRVNHHEMEDLRRRYHLIAAEVTMKWICAQYNIDYYHVDTIKVKPDSMSMQADIYMSIRREHCDKYAYLGPHERPIRAVGDEGCQDELPKKDILMVRKKRSITLA